MACGGCLAGDPGARRGEQRAGQLLQQGDWEKALELVQALQKRGRLSTAWQGRLRSLEGECQRLAADTALADKRYEDSLNHALAAAQLLNLDRVEARTPHPGRDARRGAPAVRHRSGKQGN